MIRTLCCVLILAFASSKAQTREEKTAIRGTITSFFTAMFSGDTLRLSGMLEYGATLTTISSSASGGNTITFSTRKAFMQSIRTLHPDMGLQECLYGRKMFIDSEGATVICGYHFFAKHKYSHSGNDTFILRRTASGWNIVSISDTRYVLSRPPKHECD